MLSGTYPYQDFAVRLEKRGESRGERRGRAEGLAEGIAEGTARTLLAVLAARGLSVTAAQRDRILSCTDLAVLRRWAERSATVTAVAELFD